MALRLSLLVLFLPTVAFAHVKWFSSYRLEQKPASFADLNHPTFWGLLALSVVTIASMVWLDRKLDKWGVYQKLNSSLDQYSDRATLILRVFTGASLLLAWQADAMIAPELKIPHPFWGWFQFFLAIGLLLQVTTPIAGAGMIVLYLFTITQYGLFHSLDYLVFAAIGYFLTVSNSNKPSVRDTRIPILYSGLGFSLCWVALEKIFYPNWGLEVLQREPGLTMGLDPQFFLLACAFVEFSLGYLLIICLLQRPLALTITLVFFTTTCFFGKTEVVGHTLLHGALLVFIVVGAGQFYRPPIALHRSLILRSAFAAVNFLILFVALAFPYYWLSNRESVRHSISAPAQPINPADPTESGHEHSHTHPEQEDHDSAHHE